MKRNRRKTVKVVLLFSSAIVLGGCGGGGSGNRLSKAEFADRANALCIDFSKQSDAVASASVENSGDIADSFNDANAFERKLFAGLAKLNSPAGEEGAVRKVISLGEKFAALTDEVGAAFESADQPTDQLPPTEVFDKIDSTAKQLDSLFRQLGATKCVGWE